MLPLHVRMTVMTAPMTAPMTPLTVVAVVAVGEEGEQFGVEDLHDAIAGPHDPLGTQQPQALGDGFPGGSYAGRQFVLGELDDR